MASPRSVKVAEPLETDREDLVPKAYTNGRYMYWAVDSQSADCHQF